VAPLLSGINAGDADRLSLTAGAPQLAAGHGGSLIEGLRRARAANPPVPGTPVFRGLTGGTQQLTDALTAALPDVRTGWPVGSVHAEGHDWTVTGAAGRIEADAVVLAVPSFAAAPLVRPFAADLADGLDGLEWSSVAVVTFAVPASALDVDPDASGFLVAPGEDLLMTACSFGSSKWPHWRGDDGLVVLRVSAGRHPDRRALDLPDDELVARLTGELRTTLGLRGEPAEVRVSRWERALPQYRPGHLDRARRWKEQATYHPGLYLTGASYLGLGVPACITDGQVTADAVAAHLTARSATRT
jgi:protoporphyrinogen/coproporphyrinogen III oxidase